MFRLCALGLGVVGLLATAFLYQLFWTSVVVGVLFGAGGWVIDYFTGFRKLGGQLSGWALAAGGIVIGLKWKTYFRFDDLATHTLWPSVLQYVAVVMICWGLLLFVRPWKPREP